MQAMTVSKLGSLGSFRKLRDVSCARLMVSDVSENFQRISNSECSIDTFLDSQELHNFEHIGWKEQSSKSRSEFWALNLSRATELPLKRTYLAKVAT